MTGLEWRGQYIKETSLPKLEPYQYAGFFLNAFYPNLPWLYATNKSVLIDVQSKLKEMGIFSVIEDFNNLECRFVLRGELNLHKILEYHKKEENFIYTYST